ncbi:carbohydrate kinase family protein [Halopelagius fulvigenes]|uniref:Carbohydrate kinase family protein n=1 Tax=Halopelagius fulvigenes TaxID=1198324 RepID=A0ABD5TXD3_9EURY
MSRIVCAGHVNWDVLFRVDALPEPDGEASVESRGASGGGSASNVARGLAELDEEASLLGSVGDDDHGRTAREDLAAAGVNCENVVTVPGGETATKHIVVEPSGEVIVLGCAGANEAFDADDLPAAELERADHLHLTSQRPETATELARRARDAGVPVSFDPGRRIGERAYSTAISTVDYLFLNDREAGLALDAFELDEQTLVIKHGPDGAEVRHDDGRTAHPGYPIDAVDTTGAGDAFAAGFLSALTDGADFERALAVANACGAIVSCSPGSQGSLSRERVRSFLGD